MRRQQMANPRPLDGRTYLSAIAPSCWMEIKKTGADLPIRASDQDGEFLLVGDAVDGVRRSVHYCVLLDIEVLLLGGIISWEAAAESLGFVWSDVWFGLEGDWAGGEAPVGGRVTVRD